MPDLDLARFEGQALSAANLMKAMSNESRLLILCQLVHGETTVGELETVVGLSQSALSQQLARLRREGLVETRRESQTIYYSICPGPADRIIHLLHEMFCSTEVS